jgi:hypothetical protein
LALIFYSIYECARWAEGQTTILVKVYRTCKLSCWVAGITNIRCCSLAGIAWKSTESCKANRSKSAHQECGIKRL